MQYESIVDQAKKSLEELTKPGSPYAGYQIFTTGHSMGGGMAQSFSVEENLSGFAFNTIPVSPQLVDSLSSNGTTNQLDLMVNYLQSNSRFIITNLEGDPAYRQWSDGFFLDGNPTTLPTGFEFFQTALGVLSVAAKWLLPFELLIQYKAHDINYLIEQESRYLVGTDGRLNVSLPADPGAVAITRSDIQVTNGGTYGVTELGQDGTPYALLDTWGPSNGEYSITAMLSSASLFFPFGNDSTAIRLIDNGYLETYTFGEDGVMKVDYSEPYNNYETHTGTLTVRPDGSYVDDSYIDGTGTRLIFYANADGSHGNDKSNDTDSSNIVYENRDWDASGNLSVEYRRSDGTYGTERDRVDGTYWKQTVLANGTVEVVFLNEDKSTGNHIAYADGVSFDNTDTDASRNTTHTWRGSDGSHGTETTLADGTDFGQEVDADGTEYNFSYAPDGSGTDSTRSPDGSHGTETWLADGTDIGQFFDANGTETDSTFSADGSGTEDVFNGDRTIQEHSIFAITDPAIGPALASDSYIASVDFVLPDGANDLTLTGTGNLKGEGNALDNVIVGNSGNNELIGGASKDLIIGGAGSDTVGGGPGDDTYVFNVGDGEDHIQDIAVAGEGNTLQFGAGITPAMLKLGLGSLLINVGAGGDKVHLDTFDPNDVMAGHTVETFRFADGTELSYADLIARGFDLSGTSGDDTITGTSVADRIDGKGGNDLLMGGAGSDTYIFGPGDGQDLIREASVAGDTDTLQLLVNPGDVTVTREENNLVLSLNGSIDRVAMDWFTDPNARIERVAFADGTVWNAAKLESMTAAQMNLPPAVVHAIADQQALEKSAFTFTVPADAFADPNVGQALTYSAALADGSALPSWLSFDAQTRTFSGTPMQVDVGTVDVRITATDSGGLAADDTLALTVANVNDAPMLANAIANQVAKVNLAFSIQVPTNTFVDPDPGDTLTLGAARANGTPLPTWLSFNAATRMFSGTPGQADVGSLGIRLTATDHGNLSANATFSMNVVATNAAPLVEASNATVGLNQAVAAASLFSVSDADGDVPTKYQFWDDANGGGYVAKAGVQQNAAQAITVDATELATVTYVGAGSISIEGLEVRAFDGIAWSAWKKWNMVSSPHATNAAPVVTASDATVGLGASVAASTLFSVSDADGDVPVKYELWDAVAGGGYVAKASVQQNAAQAIAVNAADLATVTYVGAGSISSEGLEVRAFDGLAWSPWKMWNMVSSPHATNAAPVVIASDATVGLGASVAASTLFSVSDADSDTPTKYEFWDDVSGGGFVAKAGVQQNAAQAIGVNAADLSTVTYVGADSISTEGLEVRAFDGLTWSAWKKWNMVSSSHATNAAPTVTASDATVGLGQPVAASTLFTVSDADGDAPVKYEFWDDVSSGGYIAKAGVQQNAAQAISVSVAELADVTYVGGDAISSQGLEVRAFDGLAWSPWKKWNMVSSPHATNAAPVVTASDATVGLGASVAASTLFGVSDADSDTPTKYEFWDDVAGGGYVAKGGLQQNAAQAIAVNAVDLATVAYVGAGSISIEGLEVRAFDGLAWSPWKKWNMVSSPHATNAAPTVTASDTTVGLGHSVAASTLFAVADADGDVPVKYELWDDVSGGGYIAKVGVQQNAVQAISVSAAELADVTYVGGDAISSQGLEVRAFDGLAWSPWKKWNMVSSPHATNAAPTVTASDATVGLGQSVAASSLFSVNDADSDAPTKYEFWDDVAGGGYVAKAGVQQNAAQAIAVNAADLSTVTYVGADSIFTEGLEVRAFDGLAWSPWKKVNMVSSPHATNAAPIVTASDATIGLGQSVAASTLFSISDADSDAPTKYEFWDDINGGGYFTKAGVQQSAGQSIAVNAAELADLRYVGSGTTSTERVEVRAFDGLAWSPWKTWNMASAPHATNAAPVVVASDATVNLGASVAVAGLFSVTDADGDVATKYEFWDDVSGGGYVAKGGVQQAAAKAIAVTAAELTDVTYVGANSISSEGLEVRAFDGQAWSPWKKWNMVSSPHATNAAPTVVASDATVGLGASVAASTLFSVSDADGDAPTKYEFWDDVAGGGYVAKGGVQQAAAKAVAVTAAELADMTYVGASSISSEGLEVRAFDGLAWSPWKKWNMVSSPHVTNAAPTVVAGDATVGLSASVSVASLFSVTDADGDVPVKYEIWDDVAGGGYVAKAGVQQNAAQAIAVTAADLATVTYVGAGSISSEGLEVRAFDGLAWSSWKKWNMVSSPHATNAAPTVTAATAGVLLNEAVSVAPLFTVSDADGDVPTKYEFWDDVNGGGYLAKAGVQQAAAKAIAVSAAELANLTYVGAASVATEGVEVRAFDGLVWSPWKKWNMSSLGGMVRGGVGDDSLSGDAGNTVLQGSAGNDVLADAGGNNLFHAGAGNDSMTGAAGKDLFIGGSGNDSISTGGGANLIAFNRGDGVDTVTSAGETGDTLSLGGGLIYSDLSLKKQLNDLVLNAGATDQIVLKDWFAPTAQRSVANLQVITEAMATYDPNSTDTLLNKKVERFDFSVIAQAFDQALAADPNLSQWSLTNKLLDAHLSGSDTEALGGDLAYQYGLNGSLAGIGVGAAQDVLSSAQFAAQPQTLRPLASIQEGLMRLG
jgi:hypothetical protein